MKASFYWVTLNVIMKPNAWNKWDGIDLISPTVTCNETKPHRP